MRKAIIGALAAVALVAVAAYVMIPRNPYANAQADPNGAQEAADWGYAQEPETEVDEVDWDYWRGINEDVVAWIKVDGTNIDYPVVQASEQDPNYYLHHDVYRQENEWGSVFVDADCDEGIDSENVVILGHHMIDGTMLSDFSNYHDQGYAEEHREITLYYPGGKRNLEATSSWTIPGWQKSKRTDFVNETDLREFKAECLDNSNVKLVGADELNHGRMYTLCTCSYFENPSNERTLVFAQET